MHFATTNNPAAVDAVSGVMIVLGILIITVLTTVSLRRKSAARQNSRTTSRELIEQVRRHAEHGRADDVDAAGARFLDDAQRLMAQLDNKAARLEQLIADADDRMQRLARSSPSRESTTPAAPPLRVESIRPPAAPLEKQTIAPRASRQNNVSSSQTDQFHGAIDPLMRAVYDLADDGRRPIEIARELDEQVGKIELILALRGDETRV